jgi:NAD-dependent DNA ligase
LKSSVSKHTDYVIVDDLNEETGKTVAAKKLGIPIVVASDFIKTYL